jgi:dephospho-CoA kinase
MPYCVGVTGGIGSGKSRAAAMFAELGADIVDTDEISHEITGIGGSAMPAVAAAFGAAMTMSDGSLDRTAMRDLVFNSPDKRKQLEDILHPRIRAEARRRVAASTAPYVLLVVPLLHETSGYRDLIQRVLVIDCDESRQITRTMERSQLTEEAVRAIMAAQMPRQQRLALADDIVDNNGDMVHLRAQVGKLHRQYLKSAASNPASG